MKRNRYLILTLICMAVIFYFSSQPRDISNMNNTFIVELLKSMGIDLTRVMPYDQANFIIRKFGHFTEYLILGMLLFRTFKTYLYQGFEMVSAGIGFLYACSDEIHQYFVPGRGPAVADVLIDTAGVIAGVLFLSMVYYYRQKSKRITI